MIATNEAADVLRHGWQNAASSLAADVPEVAELLLARLEIAIAAHRLDEKHLLDTIEEVESLTSRAGSASGEALARRLRRTVYEYLLALDAARAVEKKDVAAGPDPSTSGGPMVGAEEVAALGHVAGAATSDAGAQASAASPAGPGTAAAWAGSVDDVEDGIDAEEAVTAQGRGPRRRFGLRRRHHRDGDDEGAAAPDMEFIQLADGAGAELAEPHPQDGALTAAQPELTPSATEPEPASAAAQPEPEDEAGPFFVAPRAGFHIVDDETPSDGPEPDERPIQMPVFASDEPATTVSPDVPPESDATSPAEQAEQEPAASATETAAEPPAGTDSEFVAWRPPVIEGVAPAPTAQTDVDPQAQAAPHRAAATPPQVEPPVHAQEQISQHGETAAAATPTAAGDEPSAGLDTGRDEGAHPGWRVRDNRPGSRKRAPASPAVPDTEDDPFGTNPKLAETRRRIEERLRRKRCDEAAAMLQALARETGGRAVADLAMNAGDRCRALGKANAALNCYLAASRSDPVYELPLSRLADVCIDAQDTDLAVSYLERVAQIYRFRSDDKNAMRVYRRIATIAPYREDVLAVLMNATRSGRLD